MSMTGGQAVVRCLEQEGVEYVWGMCGHGNLGLLDALNDSSIEFIAMPHEQLAVHAADAYFRVSGRPGVVTTTVGPGLGNVTNGVLEAAGDSSALVVIAGDVPADYRGYGAFQENALHQDGSQVEMMKPIVKRAWHVERPGFLTHAVTRAFNHALTGRPGPVLVNVALDLWAYEDDYRIPDMRRRRAEATRTTADAHAIERAADLLARAERPLIYAGQGVLLSGASEELTALAGRMAIPVVTSMSAHGAVSTEHPCYGGFTGAVGTPFGNRLAQQADVVLALGTTFNEVDCNSWDPELFFPVPDCKIIQVDIEPNEIGKIYEVEVPLIGDIKAVLTDILAALEEERERSWQEIPWVRDMRSEQDDWRAELAEAQKADTEPIELERVFHEVRKALPRDGIMLSGVGFQRHLIVQQVPVFEPRTCIINNAHGTMGFSVAGTLGVKMARPDREVICVTGDGEFLSVPQAIGAAVQYGINAVWLILNNSAYRCIEIYQNRHYGRAIGTVFEFADSGDVYSPDYVALAEAYGALGRRVEHAADLGPAIEEALAAKAPYVLDVLTTHRPRIRASGRWDINLMLACGYNVTAAESGS